MSKVIDQTQELLNEARDLMESFDDCAAMTVGYDKKEYTLTAKQMTLIAGALYMADCKLNQNKQLDNLLKQEKEWTMMFDSDVRVGLALLDEIRKLNQNKEDE